MSGHGISPTWVQKNKFARGEDWSFDPVVIISIFAECDLAFIGDVNPTITISLVCDLETENPDAEIILSVDCSIAKIGDVNPTINMSTVLVNIVATGP